MRAPLVVLIALAISCSPSRENEPVQTVVNGPDALEGEYQIGDGVWTIKPVHMAYELRKSPEAEPIMLFSQPSDIDTVSVYATEDQSIVLKMYPGHSTGLYLEPDEQWPVFRVGLLAESAETDLAESAATSGNENSSHSLYAGNYELYTESEGATATLHLQHLNSQHFQFELKLDVPDVCSGQIKGEFVMGENEVGTYVGSECPLTLTLKGSWGSGMTVQIEQTGSCTPLGESCVFTGTYIMQAP
jgi:hypothetical protein